MEIAEWLRGLGLPQYERAFREHDVTPDLLPLLTVRDLKDLGIVSVGHRRRLIEAIRALGKATGRLVDDHAAMPVAERRRLSAVFCDLVGSTELSSQLDPEDLNEIIRTYQTYVQDIMAQHGGFTARYVGDGMLVYFGWPEARETDAEQAVRASLLVASSLTQISKKNYPLRVRIGIATGIAIIGELIGRGESRQLEAIGETLNRAARLQGLAEPNTVVIDDDTHAQIGDLFQYTSLGAVHLRGLPEPVQAWIVQGQSNVHSRFEALRGAQLVPLVNRVEEFSEILRRWQDAKVGRGQVVMLTGEPGIGKSRLVAEAEDRISWEPHVSFHYYCSPHYEDTALYPVVSQWERNAGITSMDLPGERLCKLEAVANVGGLSGMDIALLASLLSIPTDERYLPLELSARRRREATFEALLRHIENVARPQPLLLIIEDIHWIDPSSLEFLELLIDRIASLPVLLLGTYRADFRPPWKDGTDLRIIALDRLTREQSTELVDHIATESGLPTTLRDRIVAQTDGVPLFTEELTRAVLETTAVPRGALLSLSVPSTLQTSLMARLDRLPAAKQVAQIAAVIGREFSLSLLAAIAEMPPSLLMKGLDDLVAAGLATRRTDISDTVYLFNHGLVRDAAYESLLRSTRSAIHARIANALTVLTPALELLQPELLAQHCVQAGLISRAADYYRRAGELSIARSAIVEARSHFEKGLGLISDLPDGAERQRLEAGMLMALGSVWIITAGYGSPETARSILRAVAAARMIGEPELLIRALFGEFTLKQHIGDLSGSFLVAHEMVRVSETQKDAAIRFVAATALGLSHCFAGDFVSARSVLEQCLAERSQHGAAGPMAPLAQDPEVLARSFLSLPLAAMGMVSRSTGQVEAAIMRARQLRHQPSLAVALAIGCRQAWLIRDLENVRHRSAELVAMCEAQGYPYWLARGRCYAGAMAIIDGSVEAGRAQLEEGVRTLRESGVLLWNIHGLIGEAFAHSGDMEGALSAIEDGLALAARTGEHWSDSELHRLRGQVMKVGGRAADRVIEAELRTAIDIARAQAAPLLELRAAIELAELWKAQGKHESADELLQSMRRGFTEHGDIEMQEPAQLPAYPA
jgi:class 3 adenylate cyclase/tetratricopeptide (TPR) repeat protein